MTGAWPWSNSRQRRSASTRPWTRTNRPASMNRPDASRPATAAGAAAPDAAPETGPGEHHALPNCPRRPDRRRHHAAAGQPRYRRQRGYPPVLPHLVAPAADRFRQRHAAPAPGRLPAPALRAAARGTGDRGRPGPAATDRPMTPSTLPVAALPAAAAGAHRPGRNRAPAAPLPPLRLVLIVTSLI